MCTSKTQEVTKKNPRKVREKSSGTVTKFVSLISYNIERAFTVLPQQRVNLNSAEVEK